MSFDYQTIDLSDIENMLYLITAHAGRIEAKRFDKLPFERQQKVTLILKKRARRARRFEKPIDMFIVREVIDDAKKDLYFYE